MVQSLREMLLPSPAAEEALPSKVRVGEHTIFFRGDTSRAPAGAPDVVLVHGYIASGRYMLPLISRLAPHCRVYAPDLLGWGQSSKSCPRSLAGLADVLAAWAGGIGLHGSIFRQFPGLPDHRRAARLLPYARLVVLSGVAHAANYSDLVPLAGAVLPFIREVSLA